MTSKGKGKQVTRQHYDARVEIITPETAKKWLNANKMGNRPLSEKWVDFLAGEMKQGAWELNGATIVFSNKGNIIDGQHRLHAVIKSGVTIKSVVVRGVDESTWNTTDIVRVKTAAHIFGRDNEKNRNLLATTIRLLICDEKGRSFKSKAINREEEEYLRLHPEVRIYVNKVAAHRVWVVPTGICAMCWYQFANEDELLAGVFFDALQTGASLQEGDPVYKLRERFIKARTLRSNTRGFDYEESIALVRKAWAELASGITRKILLWNKDREEFPKVAKVTKNSPTKQAMRKGA